MRNVLSCLVVGFFMFISQPAFADLWPANALTGGAAGSLDAIDGAELSDGDGAIVTTSTATYFYILDADSGSAESSPDIIAPDTNAGDQRWILSEIISNGSTDTNLTASKPVFTDGSSKLTSSGTMPVDQGGTGQTTYTDGQLLIGNSSGNTLTKATLTGTANEITVTGGAGSITLSLPNHVGTDITADLEEEVTEGSLADSTIVSDDIKDGTIVNNDINASAAIVASKLDLTSPGAIGSTAQNTGQFTTLTATGDLNADTDTFLGLSIEDPRFIDGSSPPAAAQTLSDTNKIRVRAFDGSADEDLYFYFATPYNIDGSELTIAFRLNTWVVSATAPSGEGWSFFMQCTAVGTGDPLSQAMGSAVESKTGARSDPQYDHIQTAWSDDMTVEGAGISTEIICKLYRDIDDADDTYVQDIGVSTVEIALHTRAISPAY